MITSIEVGVSSYRPPTSTPSRSPATAQTMAWLPWPVVDGRHVDMQPPPCAAVIRSCCIRLRAWRFGTRKSCLHTCPGGNVSCRPSDRYDNRNYPSPRRGPPREWDLTQRRRRPRGPPPRPLAGFCLSPSRSPPALSSDLPLRSGHGQAPPHPRSGANPASDRRGFHALGALSQLVEAHQLTNFTAPRGFRDAQSPPRPSSLGGQSNRGESPANIQGIQK